MLFIKRLNPLTPGTFCKKGVFLEFLVIFRLHHGQITFNLVGNAFATQQFAFLATSIAFKCIVTRACAEIKILRKSPKSLGFSIFGIFFFAFPFSPFLFFLAAVIDLLLGLLAVKKTSEKASSRWAIFSMKQPGVVAGNFAAVLIILHC